MPPQPSYILHHPITLFVQLMHDVGLVAWGASYDQRGTEEVGSVHVMPDDFFFEHITPTLLDPTVGHLIAGGLQCSMKLV